LFLRAEDKALMAPPDKSALPGFYGRETMEECIAKNPRLRSGGKNGRKGLNGGGGEDMQVEGERDGQREGEEEERGFVGQQRPDGRRKSSISRWLSRKQTK